LAKDPELQQFVDGAREDRVHLRRWGQPGTTVAPEGLVREAIRHAERDALLDAPVVVRRGVLARIGGPRLAAAAAVMLAAGVGIVLGPSLLQQSNPAGPDNAPQMLSQGEGRLEQERLAMATDALPESADADEAMFESLASAKRAKTDDAPTESLGALASAPSGEAAFQKSIDGLVFAYQDEELEEDTLAMKSNEQADARESLRSRAEPSVTDSLVAIGPDKFDASRAPLGMTLDEAWVLASAHTLQISMVSAQPKALAALLIARPDIQAIQLRSEQTLPGVSQEHADLVVRLNSSQQALATLLDVLQSQDITSLVMRRGTQPVRIPSRADELFWWEGSGAHWVQPATVALRVRITQPQPGLGDTTNTPAPPQDEN
jgi:hypothetical protein